MDCYMLLSRDCYIIIGKPILLFGSLGKWGFRFATVDMSIFPLHLDGDFVKIFPVEQKMHSVIVFYLKLVIFTVNAATFHT